MGLLELGAHVVQTHGAARDADWQAARDYVGSQVKPEDLVTFAPRWVDPVGREQFGPAIATLEREARPDETPLPARLRGVDPRRARRARSTAGGRAASSASAA